ncbi:MAG: ABC transporter ATP-binding protein [Chloroflexaceae bacterium]|nr:ABC transporter ATP-binding protein [Chloroflexaceae bacterium]
MTELKAQHQLQASQLTLSYQAPVVCDLDFTLPAGKITALVGPNGCGKSTLLRGLARLHKPHRGAVYLDGISILERSTKAVAKRLGLLPQSAIAPEGLTVRQLVAQGRYPHQSWWQQWSSQDETEVETALEITGMRELGDRLVDTLSGGQRQRAWIAMVLAQNTDILLLDEPTTFLDLAHQIEILDLLHDLNRRQGRTIALVQHDLNQACRYADYLAVMKNGHLYAQGTPAQVMTETMVQEVFGIGCRIICDPVSETPLCIPIGRRAVRLT